MKLIVCARDVDDTLQAGDLIAWLPDNGYEGDKVGLYNSLLTAKRGKTEYLNRTPFEIVNAPLITEADCLVIRDDIYSYGVDGSDGVERKWKIDTSTLEQRGVGDYPPGDKSETAERWRKVLTGENIRRDTFRAYKEITRNDIDMPSIIIARPQLLKPGR